MTTRYLTLGEVLVISEAVSGTEAEILARTARVGLVESAVHAPAASFGGVEFHVGLVDKAAALAWHLARNHGLPDANKRTAWSALNVFLALNGANGQPTRPSDDEAETMIVAAAAGEWSEEQLATWLEERTVVSQVSQRPGIGV
jgi:death-on-curing protein